MTSVYGGMTDERKACIWRLWQQGVAMSVIARDIVKAACDCIFVFSIPWRHKAEAAISSIWLPVAGGT